MPRHLSNPTRYVTPETRRQEVPVDCTGHSDGFCWSGLGLEDYANLPPSDFLSPAMNHHLLVYHYKAFEGEFRHSCAGRKTKAYLRDGQLSFIPAGADNHWDFGEGGPSAFHILIDTASFEAATQNNGRELRDTFQFDSVPLQHMAKRLRFELKNGGATGPTFADTMLLLLGDTLISEFGETHDTDLIGEHSVAAARDLIEAEYARRITLQELADQCGLSQSQLLRTFRQQFGTTPHQYVLQRRVKAGQQRLLAEVETPIAQVALDLGYADQSHFTRAFTAQTGVTPDKFRARM